MARETEEKPDECGVKEAKSGECVHQERVTNYIELY